MKLENLSKLKYDDANFDSILGFVSQIKNAKIEVTNDINAIPMEELRSDEIRPSLTPGEVLLNAPQQRGGYFVVPLVVE